MFLAVLKLKEDGRLDKWREFEAKEDADAHIAFVTAEYPNAFVIEAAAKGNGQTWRLVDGALEHDPTGPIVDDVKNERERRLALGFDYDFGDGRGTHRIGTTPEDMAGWHEVTAYANALTAAGDTTTAIDIVTDTGAASITPAEWQDILLAAAAFRQPIWQASFYLQQNLPATMDDLVDAAAWPE